MVFYNDDNVKTSYPILATRAAHPADMLWENLGYTWYQRGYRRGLSLLVTLALLVISFAGVSQLSVIRGNLAHKAQQGTDVALTKLAGYGIGIAVTVVNTVLNTVMAYTASFEAYTSRTAMEASLTVKLAVAMVFNSTFSLVVSHYRRDPVEGAEVNWYSDGGLLEDVFSAVSVNMWLTPLLYMTQPGYLITILNRQFVNAASTELTQREVNGLYLGPAFALPFRVASIVNMTVSALLFAPLMPCTVVFAAVGLTLMFWADKFFLLRFASAPEWYDAQLPRFAVKVLAAMLAPIAPLSLLLMRTPARFNLRHVVRYTLDCVLDTVNVAQKEDADKRFVSVLLFASGGGLLFCAAFSTLRFAKIVRRSLMGLKKAFCCCYRPSREETAPQVEIEDGDAPLIGRTYNEVVHTFENKYELDNPVTNWLFNGQRKPTDAYQALLNMQQAPQGTGDIVGLLAKQQEQKKDDRKQFGNTPAAALLPDFVNNS